MNFFEQLTAAMGQNVKFSIQHVCEGDDQLIAAANWHMGMCISLFHCHTQININLAPLVISCPQIVSQVGSYFFHRMERQTDPIHQRLQLLWMLERRRTTNYQVQKKKYSTLSSNLIKYEQSLTGSNCLQESTDCYWITAQTRTPSTGNSVNCYHNSVKFHCIIESFIDRMILLVSISVSVEGSDHSIWWFPQSYRM